MSSNTARDDSVLVESRWRALMGVLRPFCGAGGVKAAEGAEEWHGTILERYGEPQRHYHTLRHIGHMLSLSEAPPAPATAASALPPPDRAVLELSIFFHDIIYDATRSDNEKESDVLFQQFAQQMQLDATVGSRVSAFITATITHTPVPADDALQRHFLDLDMAILSEPLSRYVEYAQEIRSEYAHIQHEKYCSARASVLRTFLSRPVYLTEAFAERERQARSNLEHEIACLDAGSIPGREAGE